MSAMSFRPGQLLKVVHEFRDRLINFYVYFEDECGQPKKIVNGSPRKHVNKDDVFVFIKRFISAGQPYYVVLHEDVLCEAANFYLEAL